jgi:hypothetical protein
VGDPLVVSEVKLWSPARSDRDGDVLCRGALKSGSVWIRLAVRRGGSGITVTYPNRRGKALAWPDEGDRAQIDRAVIAEARRRGWLQ